VHVGQLVDIKVGAFDFTKYGDIRGIVKSISGDVFDPSPNLAPASDGYGNGAENADTGGTPPASAAAAPQEPEYLVYITLARTSIDTDAGLANLQPGMAVTADIKTGRRRVISYLLSPFQHKIDDAARER
jgi:hemolysin D